MLYMNRPQPKVLAELGQSSNSVVDTPRFSCSQLRAHDCAQRVEESEAFCLRIPQSLARRSEKAACEMT
jgi:hypothetical protein